VLGFPRVGKVVCSNAVLGCLVVFTSVRFFDLVYTPCDCWLRIWPLWARFRTGFTDSLIHTIDLRLRCELSLPS
jgi:hypothetical protein